MKAESSKETLIHVLGNPSINVTKPRLAKDTSLNEPKIHDSSDDLAKDKDVKSHTT